MVQKIKITEAPFYIMEFPNRATDVEARMILFVEEVNPTCHHGYPAGKRKANTGLLFGYQYLHHEKTNQKK